MEAAVSACKCRKTRRTFGIRFEKRNNQWIYNWAFPLKENTARNEGYDNVKIEGGAYCDDSYPGCPYCKARSFFLCGACNKLTCLDIDEGVVTCGWCGNTAALSGTIDSLNLNNNW